MKKMLTLLLFVSVHTMSTAQTWQDTVAVIEKIFEQYKPTNPGCQLAISRNGNIIFSRAWGLADLEHNVPLTTESIIEAGSVSKQFTAAAILLLEQQNKLSLNDEVRKYIPELPDYGTSITLRHLMHHTSGIKDWGSVMALSDWPRGSKTYSNTDVLSIVSHQHSLNHKPGDEYLYSNSNYVLLAIIVERVSGQSLDQFTRSAIFTPAGMKRTEWRANFKKIVQGRAIAYGKNNDAYFTDMPNEYVYGNGGLLTTAEDLLRWNTYFVSGKFGNPSLLNQQISTTPLNNGQINTYAAGLRIDSIRGWPVIIHDGATAAYRSTLEYYPTLSLSIAWLANTSEFDGRPDGIGELRELLLEDKTEIKPKNSTQLAPNIISSTKPAIIGQKALEDYTGDYYSDEVDAKLTITSQNEKLIIHRYFNTEYTLTPTDKDAFGIQNSSVKVFFDRDKRSRITSLRFTTPRVRNVLFKKIRH